MSTTTAEGGVEAARPPADPFRYGWRYVRRSLPGGGSSYEQVPLTKEKLRRLRSAGEGTDTTR